MLGVILRTIWRLFILVIGIELVFLTIFRVYPYADSRLPAFIALLLIYCTFAYLIIPTLIRLLRMVVKPNHIPLYTTTTDGWAADPVNIAIVANSRKHLSISMRRAGWYEADKLTLKTNLKETYSILFNQPYPTAPFSKLYLFGRPFDIGFQKPANASMSARARHHVRFWRLELPQSIEKDSKHFHFWNRHLKHLFGLSNEIWIGAAIDDSGPLGIRWRDGQFTHSNDPDTNKERDLIISDLKLNGQMQRADTVQAGEPFSFRGQVLGTTLVCDGTIRVVKLKNPVISSIVSPSPKKAGLNRRR